MNRANGELFSKFFFKLSQTRVQELARDKEKRLESLIAQVEHELASRPKPKHSMAKHSMGDSMGDLPVLEAGTTEYEQQSAEYDELSALLSNRANLSKAKADLRLTLLLRKFSGLIELGASGEMLLSRDELLFLLYEDR